MAQAAAGHHTTFGELIPTKVSSEELLVGTNCADADLLVDDVHSAEAVEADLVETLFAGLVYGIEAGAWVLLLTAVQRPGLRGLRLCISWLKGGGRDDFLLNLLLGLELELLLGGPRCRLLIIIVVRVVDLVTIVGVLDMVWEWRQRVQVILPLSQKACRQE